MSCSLRWPKPILSLTLGFICLLPLHSEPAPKLAIRFLNALRSRNYRTVVDLTQYFQKEVTEIKSGNSKSVSQKLVEQYYENRIRTLSQAQYVSGKPNDPTAELRTLIEFLPATCQWYFPELLSPSHSSIPVTIVYPTIDGAPWIENKFLKSARRGNSWVNR
jgi:hypothetical protein